MLRKNKKKTTEKEQTYDEFLLLKPKRVDYEWSVDDKGLVHVIVPKFVSNFGKKFVKAIKKDETFTANMDKLGSFVWINCDGSNTISDLFNLIQKEFSDEEKIKERLFFFLYQMKKLNYIDY